MSRAHCLHCGKQPYGRSRSIQAVVSTARHRADHRIWTFFSAGSTRTGQCDAGRICKDIFAGNELLDQAGPEIAAFCGGVGTVGMLMGVSRALKARGCRARIVALEPGSSPVLTRGKGGPHRVEGIGVGFRPPHLKDSDFDEARTVDEQEARAVARRVSKNESIFSGKYSAMNVVAAMQLAAELGTGKTVTT